MLNRLNHGESRYAYVSSLKTRLLALSAAVVLGVGSAASVAQPPEDSPGQDRGSDNRVDPNTLTDADREIVRGQLRAHIASKGRAAGVDRASKQDVTDGITVTARCPEGYVDRSLDSIVSRAATLTDVEGVDCDENGCRALQVTARPRRSTTMDIDVAVSCSG